MKETWTK